MVARLLCSCLVVGSIAALPARANPPEIYPLEKVRRGQTGYGLTTMKGTTPERFRFEVIGVNRNFLPKMDIILVKSDDPKLAITGFWQGMSGSPLFIEGKLACAFSYGYRFNKVAIGGCTPLHYMKEQGLARPRGLSDNTKAANATARLPRTSRGTTAEWRTVVADGDPASLLSSRGSTALLRTGALPTASPTPAAAGMVPAAIPLAMSGFTPAAFAAAKEMFADFPFQPTQVGGTGDGAAGPSKFELGGSISVQLIRGDMSVAGTGTVSYVNGKDVLAFGHPMFQAGELYAPVTSALVHTVIPSALSAFVVASPLRELGSLIHDRQSTIAADTTRRTPLIPMKVRLRLGRAGKTDEFSVELLNHRMLTPALANMVTMSAMNYHLPDRDKASVLVESTVNLKDHEPLRFVDHLYSDSGAIGAIGGTRGLRVLAPLMTNPFGPIEITGVTIDAKIDFGTRVGTLKAMRLPVEELTPGQRTYATVELEQFDGKRIVERVPFDVPRSAAGSIVKLEISSGSAAKADVAPPENLKDLLELFRALLPGDVYAVTLYTANEGVAISGRLVRDLPPTIADRLRPASATPRAKVYRAVSRSVAPASRVVQGTLSTYIKIADVTE